MSTPTGQSQALWPEGAPGALGDEPQDIPTLTHFPAADPNGSAMIVCPGGGYGHLADHEGPTVAQWLSGLGIHAFVLRYRLGPRYRHPAMLQDVQRAIRLVRFNRPRHRLDLNRIGVMGFSAGGHLAGCAATLFDEGDSDAADPIDRLGSRPDLAVLAYPVISLTHLAAHAGSCRNLLGGHPPAELVALLSLEKRVSSRTPATFLFHTQDDPVVPVENSFLYAEALKKADVPYELHVYEHGRHGVGLARDDAVLRTWPELCAAWLRSHGF